MTFNEYFIKYRIKQNSHFKDFDEIQLAPSGELALQQFWEKRRRFTVEFETEIMSVSKI